MKYTRNILLKTFGRLISFSILAVLSVAVTSCDREVLPVSDDKVSLTFSLPSIMSSTTSKAAVNGSNFPPSSSAYQLGVWIMRGGTYVEQISSFKNMKSELHVGADNEIHWNYYVYDGTQLYDYVYILKNKSADVYAYYPWNSAVTDITAIPFVSGQSDWMWATPANLTAAETNVDEVIVRDLRFHHAMTCIEVNIRSLYQGNVSLTSMTLTDCSDTPRLVAGGTMNAVDGTLTCNPPTNSITITPKMPITHQSVGSTVYIIMPSVGSETSPLNLQTSPMELSFVFNGVEAKTSFLIPNIMNGEELIAFKTGYKYRYELVLDNKMDFKPIGVDDTWGTRYFDFEL